MKTQPRENERRDSVIIIVLILLLGFICIIVASGWALRFAPSWKLDTNMGSNLDPNSDFLTSRPVSFIEPLDPAILTNPAWMDVFLTPGASSSLPTRTPLPASTATSAPVKTSTPLTTTVTATTIVNPTNTLIYFPPTITATPRPPATSIPITSVTPLPSADLAITKTDGVASVIVGGTTTYTVRVTNNGPSSVTGAILSDPIAAGLNKTGVACSATPGQCVTAPTIAQLQAGTFALPALVSGQFYEITITANVTALSGSVTNTATVTPPVGTTDPAPGNNISSDTDTVSQVADLAITKTDGVVTYTPGGAPLIYTIIVTNNGPDGMTGATVTDSFSAQITSANWTCATAGSATCGAASGSGNINELVNLPVGSTVTYTVTATTSANAVGILVNTATVSVPVSVTDTNAGNNTATDSDTSTITNPNIGPPDGISFNPGQSGSIVFVFSPAIIANGDVGVPDFVYYEILATPTLIDMDWVMIEISLDGSSWIPVFVWGDGFADTNSNVNINNPAFGGAEDDNRSISIIDLYNGNTSGITIDIDAIPGVIPGSYPWMRISGIGGMDGPDVDALQPITP